MFLNKTQTIPENRFYSITDQIDLPFTADEHPLTSNKKEDTTEILQTHLELYQTNEMYLPKFWLEQLTIAIKNNQIAVVQAWLAIDQRLLTVKLENDYSAFHLAAQFGSLELTQVIVEQLRRTDQFKLLKPVDFKPIYLNILLTQALVKEDKETFLFLSSFVDWKQTNIPQQLAIQGLLEPLVWLLEQGLSLDYRDEEGNTLLLLSILHNKIALTKFLLNKGANPRALDKQQRTPFWMAVEKSNLTAASLLITKQEALQTWSLNQVSALHVAVGLGDSLLVELLLKVAKTLVDLIDREGNTPLHIAAKAGHDHLISLLINAGADPKAENFSHQTVSAFALNHGKVHTAILIKRSARALKRKKLAEMDDLHQQLKSQAKRIEQLEQALEQMHTLTLKIEAEKKPIVNQYLYQTNKQSAGLIKTLDEKASEVYSLQLLPHNQLAVGALNGVIKIFDLNTQTCLKKLLNHGSVFSLQALGNEQLASGLADGTIKIWDLNSGHCLKSFKAHDKAIYCLRLLTSGELISASGDSSIRIWDLNGQCVKSFYEHEQAVRSLHPLSDGYLLTAALDEGIKKWQMAASNNFNRKLKKLPLISLQGIPVVQPLTINDLVAVALGSDINIYDLNQGARVALLEDHCNAISCLQILPSGHLISAAKDNTIKVWNIVSNTWGISTQCIKTLKEHNDYVTCLQPLPNGELISGSADGTVRVWDLTEFVKVDGHEKPMCYYSM